MGISKRTTCTEDTHTFEIKTDKETFIEEVKVQFQIYMKD